MADSTAAWNDSPPHLLDKANRLIVSVGMAFAFKRVLDNVAIGDSLFDEAGAKTVQQPSSCDVTGRGKGQKYCTPALVVSRRHGPRLVLWPFVFS
ncbi:hypothetical protein SPBR_05433 [Sporothrix brasiliensis 5110]|uniref:phosphoglycerate kinase n=1 Tax=Sporothrix brasiliensis 5110 TaxID=1398154 RepID=A0A0C2IPU8_9PEZI|nr:uncharacterized protein SPBR_05433 [Sporothrix brasiliensis 5110]KIH87092.1 hypothetical protein SPBR_05433 [Sporothrix brasiliensis 5110]